MNFKRQSLLTKFKWSLPWLMRCPLWRARELAGRLSGGNEPRHLIFIVANHFEPGWNEQGATLDWSTQLSRLDRWCEKARAIGEAVRDHDGTPFRHTNFYPAEQYHPRILERMAGLQAEGFGEVEVHLHHGVDAPDDAANLRRALEEFRDRLAEEHKCLSRQDGAGLPMYAFVHGNWALANSAGGRYCGVDSEMQILAETGCYADFTLPSAPDESQVARINAVYQCGHPLEERKPHRSGPSLRVGEHPRLPVLFTGPLVFNWRRRIRGLDRKSTRLNSSHANISYAVFCLKKKTKISYTSSKTWRSQTLRTTRSFVSREAQKKHNPGSSLMTNPLIISKPHTTLQR